MFVDGNFETSSIFDSNVVDTKKIDCNSIFKFETEVNMKTEQQISYAKT